VHGGDAKQSGRSTEQLESDHPTLCRWAACIQEQSRMVGIVTEHYSVAWDGPEAEAEEFGLVAEAAWPFLARLFRAEPDIGATGRLPIRFFATRAAKEAALSADGAGPEAFGDKNGGYYFPKTRTCYLHRQPTTMFNRQLALHEIVHQFHYNARTGNTHLGDPRALWYVEGLADFCSHHHWDGTTLQLGVVPLLAQDDWYSEALLRVKSGDFDLHKMVVGQQCEARPPWLAFMSLLVMGNGGSYLPSLHTVADIMDRGRVPGNDFWSAKLWPQLGGLQNAHDELKKHMEARQSPLRVIFRQWQSCGIDSIRGVSDPDQLGVCVTKLPATRVAASVRLPTVGKSKFGVVTEFQDGENYTWLMMTYDAGGRAPSLNSTERRVQGGRWADGQIRRIPCEGLCQLVVEASVNVGVSKRTARALVNGKPIACFQLGLQPQPMGFAVFDADVTFTNVLWNHAAGIIAA
jgi:hypothetical protein